MVRLDEQMLSQFGSCLAVPLFLVDGTRAVPLNREAEALDLSEPALPGLLQQEQGEFSGLAVCLDGRDGMHRYLMSGKQIESEGHFCWLLQAVPAEDRGRTDNLHRIATAREIMLQVSSQIDQLETDHDIYEFILENCGKAVEHASLCSLMVVENGRARIVAKRGFEDEVYNISFDLKDTFLSLETEGRLDRIVIINDLSKYRSSYHTEAKTEQKGGYLESTLATPIYVNHELYAILNFDSTQRNTFTMQDEELLYIVKSNIEIILANHRMHAEILRLSQTDLLTGLYNRTYLQAYLRKNIRRAFTVGIFDMNDLKKINDQHGHRSGDLAIVRFTSDLRAAFPPESVFFRMGGDEFMCILYDMSGEKIAACIAGLRAGLAASPLTLADGASAALAFSCGFAEHEACVSSDRAFQEADHLMYEEKRRMKQGSR